MIIFDLACLANDEHRRHFIEKPWDHCHECYSLVMAHSRRKISNDEPIHCSCGRYPLIWEEDCQAYYDAADKDELVEPVKTIMFAVDNPYEIWSFQCISTFAKVEKWLSQHMNKIEIPDLKMRPIGDTRPQEELFEEWFCERCSHGIAHDIDFVFSSHKSTIDMFRSYGIFVFDCNQGQE